ncbi:MAG TPA: hypothetical protein VJW51_08655 [Candidatus Acidoferrales bacterium]|nr:hypothetical protein [Candidatus Acidoferrales bacterium]
MRLPFLSRRRCVLACVLLAAAAMGATACRRLEYVSMRPLDEAGFRYSSIQQLQQLDVTKPEVDELVKAAKGGVGEAACVLLVETARAQKTHFAEGDAAASLHAAGIADQAVVELAGLRQLGAWAGEAAAIRLTGTSDRVIIAVAKGRAAGQPEPSGALLARMKDAGVSEATIIELVGRGMSDSDATSVVWRKKRGWKDEQILHDYPPKS